MDITQDVIDWPVAQFKDNIEDRLFERYEVEVLNAFPDTAEVLAVLKASDSKLSDETNVLILYRHEGKGLEGIISVDKISSKNDFFLAWEFFTTVESRSSPDSKPKNVFRNPAPILTTAQEEKVDMEIFPNSEIESTTYACLMITATENENSKSLFEAIKNLGQLSTNELNLVRITSLAKGDSWQISSANYTVLEKLIGAKLVKPFSSITRRPDTDQQFPKERQRWIQISQDIPNADKAEYLKILVNHFWKDKAQIVGINLSQQGKKICIEFKTPAIADYISTKYGEEYLISKEGLKFRFLQINSDSVSPRSFHEITFLNPATARKLPIHTVLEKVQILVSEWNIIPEVYTINNDIRIVIPCEKAFNSLITNKGFHIQGNFEPICRAMDVKQKRISSKNSNNIPISKAMKNEYIKVKSDIEQLKEENQLIRTSIAHHTNHIANLYEITSSHQAQIQNLVHNSNTIISTQKNSRLISTLQEEHCKLILLSNPSIAQVERADIIKGKIEELQKRENLLHLQLDSSSDALNKSLKSNKNLAIEDKTYEEPLINSKKGKKKLPHNLPGGPIRRKKVDKLMDPYPFKNILNNNPTDHSTTTIPPSGGIVRVSPEPSKEPQPYPSQTLGS
eukprot:TRINITY_DN3535_c0_g1_i2.p1 TRINITY_DN3535_c0_g1~~TRINITY_DN3535_c0_g1_i2.p1  ORF type:complete len:698 (-),score=131.76 TRINITY_DN3535_c0_g1_i2:446-2317(-)